MQELDGIELADFWQRAGAFLLDAVYALLAVLLVAFIVLLVKWAIETGADLSQKRRLQVQLRR